MRTALLLPLLVSLSAGLDAPVLPISIAARWPPQPAAACGGAPDAYCGDIRAVVQLAAGDIVGSSATVQVWWRRRDAHPENKTVLVLSAADDSGGFAVDAAVEGSCGIISFSRANLAPGAYHIYFLPYHQSSGGAGLRFSWQGCASEAPTPDNICVRRRRLSRAAASACTAVAPGAAAVVGLETRDAFNAHSDMELLATASEAAATAAALAALSPAPFAGVFPEAADRSVRVLDLEAGVSLPARWALGGAGPQVAAAPRFAAAAAPGQFLAFQLGLWAYAGAIANVSAAASPLLTPGGGAIAAAAISFLNLGGTDVAGSRFNNTQYALPQAWAGSLWVGVAVPADAAAGAYAGTLTLSATAGAPVAVALALTIAGAPVPRGGADDIASMARLAWLDSTLGIDDSVPAPFVPVGAAGGAAGAPLVLSALRKALTLGEDGLPAQIAVTFDRVRRGAPSPALHTLLAAPASFTLHSADGAPLPATVSAPAAVSARRNASLDWTAAWSVLLPGGGGALDVALAASWEMTSYASFAVTITNGGAAPAALGDVRLTLPLDRAAAAYIVGMDNGGAQAAPYRDKQWRWVNHTGANKLWLGRPEAGLLLALNGDGDAWASPMFNIDYATIPFIPPTWGGVGAVEGAFGVNVTNATAVAFSGPRTLAAGEVVTFRFDLAVTPSKAVDWKKHWSIRGQQLGYDVPYGSPQEMAAKGVSVATLHQGCPGIINGSLINPYINYPFLDDTVPLLTNYSAQANALGISVKFYYTVRELSSRAPEMFAWHAFQGEIVTDQDPWIIVQDGYVHDWDTHGGAAFLHQHMVRSYGACWQQQLSNGEIDPSVCVRGVSRIFNYYLAGLDWSFSQPPYINGVYYDGISFTRPAMLRVRRVADAAAARAGKGFPALLDLHTGRSQPPETCSYASHYPFVDYVWNGEGYDFSAPPAYWLIETSALIHGLSGDMLGSGDRSIFRGLLFGMTQRDAAASQAIWRAWDAARIADTTAVYGWWEADAAAAVNLTFTPPPQAAAAACTYNVTQHAYWGSTNEQCQPQSGPTPGCWLAATLADTQAACCADPACAGFSFTSGAASGAGCCKAEVRERVDDAGYDGFRKVGWAPPGQSACVLATVWATHGARAVIVVANFCGAPVNATLAVGWAELGLDAATALAALPAIDGVQPAQQLPSPSGPFELGTDGGLFMLVTAPP